ncbi:peptidylprolyl isomerase [Sediminitomix flava]|uniref:Peptidyl-prolyl cis-trans isomerase n=1 Tax=Sediminitomix flava TaxID=379075 RepID=A0A315YZ86_SEDFL|nr:peptidylprolyl isomerase [Sediminitomix flava]PWJ34218.1 peptidylprolyl isomerase/peptidyl-prolyl cis-trans isomerase B (cyclophilin B) [Sediminitomix flava]
MNFSWKIALLGLLVLSACQKKEIKTAVSDPNNDFLVKIHTELGDIYAVLYKDTPKHRENFLKLAQEEFYDKTLFHRVIRNSIVQGGDPTSKDAHRGQKLGKGDIGYTIPAEMNPTHFHKKGALAAARLPDSVNPEKESNGSQFYFVVGKKFSEQSLKKELIDYKKLIPAFREWLKKDELIDLRTEVYWADMDNDQKKVMNWAVQNKEQIEKELNIELDRTISEQAKQFYLTEGGMPLLDGDYTVFGEIVKGMEVVEKMSKLRKDKYDRPIEDISMEITVSEIPKDKLRLEFGYVE